MNGLQGTAFVALIAMVFIWFHCVRKLSGQLRDRHPEKYDEMQLEDLWPRTLAGWLGTFDNSGPVFALCGFLFSGDFRSLNDPKVSSLSVFMRRLAVVYLAVFGFLFYSILNQPQSGRAAQGVTVAAAPATAPVSEAESTYSRAVEHWRAGRTEEALADFRRVIDLEPSNFNAHLQADHLLANQRRWDEVLALWDGYLRVEPRDANAYWERGGANYHKGDFTAAQADAAKACELGRTEACAKAEQLKGKP